MSALADMRIIMPISIMPILGKPEIGADGVDRGRLSHGSNAWIGRLARRQADHIELDTASQRASDILTHVQTSEMPIRVRKLIGTIALLALVIVWALVAMAFAQPVLATGNRIYEAIYYVLAGIGWVLPAMPIVAWMSRPGKEEEDV